MYIEILSNATSKFSYGRRKDEIGYSHVAIAALQCAVTVVYAVNEGLSKGKRQIKISTKYYHINM